MNKSSFHNSDSGILFLNISCLSPATMKICASSFLKFKFVLLEKRLNMNPKGLKTKQQK